MKYFIILFFLTFDLKSTVLNKVECDSISYDTQVNKNYIEIKQDFFGKSAFIIQDTCFFQNRFIEKAIEGVIQYYPSYLLSKDEVMRIERFIYEELKLKHIKLTKKEKKYLQTNCNRQYVAFINSYNEIEVNAYFCNMKFLNKNVSFKYAYLLPLMITPEYEGVYSCRLILSKDSALFKGLKIQKVS